MYKVFYQGVWNIKIGIDIKIWTSEKLYMTNHAEILVIKNWLSNHYVIFLVVTHNIKYRYSTWFDIRFLIIDLMNVIGVFHVDIMSWCQYQYNISRIQHLSSEYISRRKRRFLQSSGMVWRARCDLWSGAVSV